MSKKKHRVRLTGHEALVYGALEKARHAWPVLEQRPRTAVHHKTSMNPK